MFAYKMLMSCRWYTNNVYWWRNFILSLSTPRVFSMHVRTVTGEELSNMWMLIELIFKSLQILQQWYGKKKSKTRTNLNLLSENSYILLRNLCKNPEIFGKSDEILEIFVNFRNLRGSLVISKIGNLVFTCEEVRKYLLFVKLWGMRMLVEFICISFCKQILPLRYDEQ